MTTVSITTITTTSSYINNRGATQGNIMFMAEISALDGGEINVVSNLCAPGEAPPEYVPF